MVLAITGLSVGCRLIFWTTAAAVGTVGLVGYSVYKGGESVVTGVGDLAGGDKSGANTQETVVLSKDELKAECPGGVSDVWRAGTVAFREAKLNNIGGTFDYFSGELTAQTWDDSPVTLKLKNTGENRTTIWIRFGAKGDLNASESLYKLMRKELNNSAANAPSATPKDVTQ